MRTYPMEGGLRKFVATGGRRRGEKDKKTENHDTDDTKKTEEKNSHQRAIACCCDCVFLEPWLLNWKERPLQLFLFLFFFNPKDILATQNPSDLPVMVAMYLNTAYLLAALLALFARGRSNAFQYFPETICIFLLMHAEDLSREKLQIF